MTSVRFVVAILAGCWLTASRRRRRRSYHLGFPIGVGARVDDIMATAIPGFYMSPYEDLRLKRS